MRHQGELPTASKRRAIVQRIRNLNLLTVRSWNALYHVVSTLHAVREEPNAFRQTIHNLHRDTISAASSDHGSSSSRPLSKEMDPLGQLLVFAHQELGRRALCGLDNGG